MNVSQSASSPIISLVSLLRSGAEMHTVSPVVPPCQATGQIVAGLRLEGMVTWIPVLMDNMHLWLLMDQSGSLLTQELSPICSGGDRMECEADTQVLLDSGANLHVCPRDFSPPGSTDHHISFFKQPSAVNVQGHRDRLDTEREIRLHMGALDFTYTTYVSSTIDNIILSMGLLLAAGAAVHFPVMDEESQEDHTLEIGYMCAENNIIPIYAHGNATWLLVYSGQTWPPSSPSSASSSSTNATISMLSIDSLHDESGADESQASVQDGVSDDIQRAPEGTLCTQDGDIAELSEMYIPDEAMKRHELPGAAESVAMFAELFADCAEGSRHLSEVCKETDKEGYSVMTSATVLIDTARTVFPNQTEYFHRIVGAALLASQLRFQDYSIREYILVVWLLEGQLWLRSHGGSVFIYHDDGAFQEYRHSVTPESTLGRLKDALLTVEGIFRLLGADAKRDEDSILDSILKLYKKHDDETKMFDACRRKALSANPNVPMKRPRPSLEAEGMMDTEVVTDPSGHWTDKTGSIIVRVSQSLMERILK